LIKSYDDEFFRENNLLIVLCGNNASDFVPKSLTVKGNELNLLIYNGHQYSVGTGWGVALYIPIKKEHFDGETVNIEYVRPEWEVFKAWADELGYDHYKWG